MVAALLGLAFKNVLYKTEDVCDRLWRHRPEWARPAVGGVALGLLLLAVPQLYGVGYPVMYKAVAGSYALWFLVVLVFTKMVATSLTIGIGGSGGVFAPSLFIGATSGMAFGEVVNHLFGPGAGQPALYAVVAMGAVFTSAARAPLTSLASVVEMTGDYTLTLPVMLAVAIATVVSRALSYGTIYTTKLLRRGIDIDHAPSADPFEELTAADAMRPFQSPLTADPGPAGPHGGPDEDGAVLPGPVTHQGAPQVLFANEPLAQAVRQLVNYGRDGLPVMSIDGQQLEGWLTSPNVLQAIARQMATALAAATPPAHLAAGWALADQQPAPDDAPVPLRGYQVVEVTIGHGSPAVGPHTRRDHLAARLGPGLGPGRPHAARPRPGRHPQPRRPRQPAWPGDGWPRPPGPTRRARNPARPVPRGTSAPDQRTTVTPGAGQRAR